MTTSWTEHEALQSSGFLLRICFSQIFCSFFTFHTKYNEPFFLISAIGYNLAFIFDISDLRIR